MLGCLIVVVVVMVKVIYDELSTTQTPTQISLCSGLSDISGNVAARFSATLMRGPLHAS